MVAPLRSSGGDGRPGQEPDVGSFISNGFSVLPCRTQEILWHSVVEQEPDDYVAKTTGDRPDAVDGLTDRALIARREACLRVHRDQRPTPQCPAFAGLVDAAAGREDVRRNPDLRRHIVECPHCAAVLRGLIDFDDDPRLIWPTPSSAPSGPPTVRGGLAHHKGDAVHARHGLRRTSGPNRWSRNSPLSRDADGQARSAPLPSSSRWRSWSPLAPHRSQRRPAPHWKRNHCPPQSTQQRPSPTPSWNALPGVRPSPTRAPTASPPVGAVQYSTRTQPHRPIRCSLSVPRDVRRGHQLRHRPAAWMSARVSSRTAST